MKFLVVNSGGEVGSIEVKAGDIANFRDIDGARTHISLKNGEAICVEMSFSDVKDAMRHELRWENQQEPKILLHIHERVRNSWDLEYLPIWIPSGNIKEMVRCCGIYQKPFGKLAEAIGKEKLTAKGDSKYQPTRITFSSPVAGPRGLQLNELTVCEEMEWILEQIANQQKV